MTEQFVKMYQFKLSNTTEESAFLKLSADMDLFLKTQEGFTYRCLARQDDGLWLDTLYFADREAADAMSANFEQSEVAGMFMTLLDMPSVKVTSADILSVACNMDNAEAAA